MTNITNIANKYASCALFSRSKPPMPPQNLPPLLPNPVSPETPSSLGFRRDNFSRRKTSHSSQFMSFRKFSSPFRLNFAYGNTHAAQPSSATTGDADDTDAANFYQRNENLVSGDTSTGPLLAPPINGGDGGSERLRTYSAALPSASYLGIPIGIVRGGNKGVDGAVSGLPQPSDSTTTTTSTGVSTDAYSTSSNFFSLAESSAESLRVSTWHC